MPHGFQCEVIRLKMLLDGQDQADGISGHGQHQTSRFWDGAREGHFGPKLQEYADNGDRKTIQRWITANDAAAKLLGDRVAQATRELPFELARERGMGQTALCTYMRLFPKAQEMATHYFTVTGELRSNMLQEFEQIIREFPNKVDEVTDAITNRILTVPSEFKAQKETWRQEIAIQKALIEEQERQDKLAAAEAEEEALDKEPTPEPTPVAKPKTEERSLRPKGISCKEAQRTDKPA